MSDVNINYEFSEFGRKIRIVAIIVIIGPITSIPLFFFSLIPSTTLFIVSILISIIPSILLIIFNISALVNVKRINLQLNNHNLAKFHSLLLGAIIFTNVLFAILLGVMSFFLVDIMSKFYPYPPSTLEISSILEMIMILFIFLGIVFAIIIIAAIIEMKAWDNLNNFFIENASMFPPNISKAAIDGSKNLKTAALCTALIFLIITGIIGIVFKLIGYFSLAKLKDLTSYTYQKPPDQLTSAKAGTIEYARYCPYCGAQLEPEARFCMKCGKALN